MFFSLIEFWIWTLSTRLLSILILYIYGTKVWLWFSIYSLNYNYMSREQRKLIQIINTLGFKWVVIMEKIGFYFWIFSLPTLQIIKETDNWVGGEPNRKTKSQTTCFWFIWDCIPCCRHYSELHFRMFKAVFWNNFEMKKNCKMHYVKLLC